MRNPTEIRQESSAAAATAAQEPTVSDDAPSSEQSSAPAGTGSSAAGGVSSDGLKRLRQMVDEDPVATKTYEDATRRNSLLVALSTLRMDKARLKQADVARAMGTTQSAISEIEQGRSDIYVGTLQRYARAIRHRLDIAIVHEDLPIYDAGLANGLWAIVQQQALSPILTTLVTARARPEDRTLDALAKSASLNPAVAQSVLTSLHSRGWVKKEDSDSGGPDTYSLDESAAHVIGVSVHPRRVEGVLLDAYANVLQHATIHVDDSKYETIIKAAVDVAVQLHSMARGHDVLGVGVSIAGVVTPKLTGTVRFAPDLEDAESPWTDVYLEMELQTEIQARLRDNTILVAVQNDANALALLKYWQTGDRSVAVLLMSGAGVGTGIITNGDVLHGSHYAAGEGGHTIVGDGKGPKCRLGLDHEGCLETVASAQGILQRLGLPADHRKISTQLAIADERVRSGDQDAINAFREAGRAVGGFAATVTAIIDPSRVVLFGHREIVDLEHDSGRVFHEGFDIGWRGARSTNRRYEDPELGWEELTDSVNAVAAGAAAMRSFLYHPTKWRPAVVPEMVLAATQAGWR